MSDNAIVDDVQDDSQGAEEVTAEEVAQEVTTDPGKSRIWFQPNLRYYRGPYALISNILRFLSLETTTTPKRGRGRPKGSKNKKSNEESGAATTSSGGGSGKKRGRPPKVNVLFNCSLLSYILFIFKSHKSI